jgi:hypothetical protein
VKVDDRTRQETLKADAIGRAKGIIFDVDGTLMIRARSVGG